MHDIRNHGSAKKPSNDDSTSQHSFLRRIFRNKPQSHSSPSRRVRGDTAAACPAAFIPNLPKEHVPEAVFERIEQIKDWQITHGSLIKLYPTSGNSNVQCQPIAFSIEPTPFPRRCFEDALLLQKAFNQLYADLIQTDRLGRCLWEVYKAVKLEDIKQPIIMGIFRSDYMLAVESPALGLDDSQIKQVEFNTYSVAGVVHSHRVTQMHHHLNNFYAQSNHIPSNDNISAVISTLAEAHELYGQPIHARAVQKAILIIVQPDNVNIADERPIEYGLWSRSPPVPTYRLEFGEPVLARTSLGGQGELLYRRQDESLVEVSVVYLRAGYDEAEYVHDSGKQARLQLERSRAIKCPNVLTHLATLKRVQQALSMPGVVERFLTADDAVLVRKTLAAMYPLDTSEEGFEARLAIATTDTARNFVLKPNLEGGGHNVYGEDIPAYLSNVPAREWQNYILMEKIKSPNVNGSSMLPKGLYQGPVISELGIFGSVIWRRNSDARAISKVIFISNENAGWSFKTKRADIKEMSVIKGYGSFDVPALKD